MHKSDKLSLISFDSNVIYDLSPSFVFTFMFNYFHYKDTYQNTQPFFFLLSRIVFVQFLYIYIYICIYTYLHTYTCHLCTRHLTTTMVNITMTIHISSFSLLLRVLQFLLIRTALYYIETKLNSALRADAHCIR
jgi:hypothetical protein